VERARNGVSKPFTVVESSERVGGVTLGIWTLTGNLLAEDGDEPSCERESPKGQPSRSLLQAGDGSIQAPQQ
jgi:hypothetical protein